MAVIAASTFKGLQGPQTVTRTVLSASDSLVYAPGQILDLFNTTASPVTVTLTGSAATTIAGPQGHGGTISVAGGKAITVPASSTVWVNLDTVAAFLAGTVTVTGGVGVTAHLVS